MAVDDSKSKRRWGFKKGDIVTAQKKERGRTVTVPPPVPKPKKSSGHQHKDAAKLLERRCLERIIHALPTHQRTQWPNGNSDSTPLSNGGVSFRVELRHKSSHRIIASTTIPKDVIDRAEFDKINLIADELADRITREIRSFHESESSRGDARSAPPPPTDPSDDSFFQEQVSKALSKQQLEKMKPKVGTAGPFCIICGPEDRTKYPDWNTCPHNPEGST